MITIFSLEDLGIEPPFDGDSRLILSLLRQRAFRDSILMSTCVIVVDYHNNTFCLAKDRLTTDPTGKMYPLEGLLEQLKKFNFLLNK
jgi:hypothetical protein